MKIPQEKLLEMWEMFLMQTNNYQEAALLLARWAEEMTTVDLGIAQVEREIKRIKEEKKR